MVSMQEICLSGQMVDGFPTGVMCRHCLPFPVKQLPYRNVMQSKDPLNLWLMHWRYVHLCDV
ncbi:hypothetical protein PAXRUDRAFT_504356 [Paxillus rubicundulus Ve08.2h10]|uniref:Uncharacterized protein n=1 Tax=Paxillus rubicundulus Ve08.2h10 TaxID=930991 RepID=A0A0D0D536_9AGAM|nr:hypothetical protein PAXRUDRAFT_504356 [Paxillus rubicundulus Ve08.2h10]